MLAITENAAEAIKAIVTSSELPEGSGIRISGGTAQADPALELSLAETPEEAEQVVERDGAQVFLEAEVATYLEDKTLDAEIAGEQVNFTVFEQEETEDAQ